MVPFSLKVYRKLYQSNWSEAHPKAATSANKAFRPIKYPHPLQTRFGRPNPKTITLKYKRDVRFLTPRKFRSDVEEDMSTTNFDAVFQGIQLLANDSLSFPWPNVLRAMYDRNGYAFHDIHYLVSHSGTVNVYDEVPFWRTFHTVFLALEPPFHAQHFLPLPIITQTIQDREEHAFQDILHHLDRPDPFNDLW